MTCQMMMSLGVYALGAADAQERRRVEAHLPGCPACRAELMRLAPLPGLLARVPEDVLAAGQPPGARPGRPAAGRGRRRSGRTWRAAAVAASVAAIAGAGAGAAGGFWLRPADVGRRPATITLSGANPATHMDATAALTATSWGTSIQLRLHGLPLNIQCRLIVRSRAGGTEVAGVWDAWRDGPITVPASAAWLPSDIASLQVASPARNLVTINVSQRSGPHGTPAGARRIP
jgi:hypothetical protein